ncbi:MAG: hypothetical protein WAN46_19355 [Gammaproteobacteria bacterium]|jgi:hypothetical protein
MFKAPKNQTSPRLSTDAQFWFYLAPFLLGAVGIWGYLISWVSSEAPTFVMGVVSFFATGA